MSRTTRFVLTQFQNPTGTVSWRVSGWLAGVRIRKNFQSRHEAAAEKATLELMTLQATAGMRLATTFLSDEKLRQAEDAFRRIKDQPHSLNFCIDYTLANYRPPESEKPLADAVGEYRAMKEREHERTLLSERQALSIKYEMRALTACFPAGPVSQLTPALLTSYLERRQ